MNKSKHYSLYAIALLLVLLGGWGCANMGAPEGGPYDITPPKLVKAMPEQGALGVKERKLSLRFDEFVKLVGQQEKVIVSPPQTKQARISASGKIIDIILEDSLRPNTTYSFYFDDAIVDNNEENPLENFSYSFSTGETLDSMQLIGTVLDAQTLEPVSGVLLGAYWSSDLSDTLFRTKPFPFVSKTNKMGQFAIRGLKDSVYSVFALKDDDNDFKYSLPSEGIAFDTLRHKTTLLDSMRTDTIRIDSIVRRDTLHRDSLVTYPYTYYYPRNLLLRYFVAESKRQGLERYSRVDSLICRLEFASELDTIPALRLLEPIASSSATPSYIPVQAGKIVDYWLTDSTLIHADSIRFGVTYAKTDSLMKPHIKTDTLVFYRPKSKSGGKNRHENASEFAVRLEGTKGAVAKTPADTLMLLANRPLASFPDSVIRVTVAKDSVYTPAKFGIKPVGTGQMKYRIDLPWQYGHKYKVTIDSAGLRSIYGDEAKALAFEHQIEKEAELGGLTVSLTGLNVVDSLVVGELLDKSGKVLMTTRGRTSAGLVSQAKSMEADTVLAKLLKPNKAKSDTINAKIKVEKSAKLVVDSLAMIPKDSLVKPDTLAQQPQDSLSKQSNIEAKASEKTTVVAFRDLKPEEYYLRFWIDSNGDGVWTTGRYPDRAPEEVYYAPKAYAVKKGFTTEEQLAPRALPLDKQKPEELRKTKPEEKKKRVNKNIEYYKRQQDKKTKQTSSSVAMPSGLPGGF